MEKFGADHGGMTERQEYKELTSARKIEIFHEASAALESLFDRLPRIDGVEPCFSYSNGVGAREVAFDSYELSVDQPGRSVESMFTIRHEFYKNAAKQESYFVCIEDKEQGEIAGSFRLYEFDLLKNGVVDASVSMNNAVVLNENDPPITDRTMVEYDVSEFKKDLDNIERQINCSNAEDACVQVARQQVVAMWLEKYKIEDIEDLGL